ncbi:uncharacterized protein LOC115628007 [Scaptodrosophila lebanonensis]|uniref:Uncharacterized protein LOC115628007 n=1 Tax=Drosophila lebanonensis TaxID=7225 RepID=A0A6J2TW66_DROLE|nr:uncharacterized protein LOC115628007 [Scaptodrosophila lebanonensis]
MDTFGKRITGTPKVDSLEVEDRPPFNFSRLHCPIQNSEVAAINAFEFVSIANSTLIEFSEVSHRLEIVPPYHLKGRHQPAESMSDGELENDQEEEEEVLERWQWEDLDDNNNDSDS